MLCTVFQADKSSKGELPSKDKKEAGGGTDFDPAADLFSIHNFDVSLEVDLPIGNNLRLSYVA